MSPRSLSNLGRHHGTVLVTHFAHLLDPGLLYFQRVCWEVLVEALLYLQHSIHHQLNGVDGLVRQT